MLLDGIEGSGREWIRDKWGVDAPLAQVELQIRSEIVLPKRGRVRPRAGGYGEGVDRNVRALDVSVRKLPISGLSETPENWPQIEFRDEFEDEFEDEFGRFDRTYLSVNESIAKAAA